jgi:hypothetical protein
VRTWQIHDERRAVRILTKHSGRDVHVHSLPESAGSARSITPADGPSAAMTS